MSPEFCPPNSRQQGRITTQQLSNAQNHIDQRNYAYDLNGNIIEKTSTPQTHSYRYDARDRLVGDSQNNNNEQQFDYDLNDNRTRQQQAISSLIDQYIYKNDSNQLSSQTRIVADDSPPGVADRELVYNDAGRLFQLIDNGQLKAEYIYNDHGLRSRKILHHSDGSTQTIIYHYTINNQLFSETNQDGQLIRDYIWMEAGYPVAQIDHNNGTEKIIYLHNDHLMTARLATDTNQNIVWHWDGDAFGGSEPVASGGVSVNMRFPGQYFDLESGLFYNWNRYYDPGLGRYITSDPIGLQGGNNTYGYVGGNPVSRVDPLGLLFDGTNISCYAVGMRIICVTGQRPPPPGGVPIDGPLSPLFLFTESCSTGCNSILGVSCNYFAPFTPLWIGCKAAIKAECSVICKICE